MYCVLTKLDKMLPFEKKNTFFSKYKSSCSLCTPLQVDVHVGGELVESLVEAGPDTAEQEAPPVPSEDAPDAGKPNTSHREFSLVVLEWVPEVFEEVTFILEKVPGIFDETKIVFWRLKKFFFLSCPLGGTSGP